MAIFFYQFHQASFVVMFGSLQSKHWHSQNASGHFANVQFESADVKQKFKWKKNVLISPNNFQKRKKDPILSPTAGHTKST
jgi:hypothetical protein